MDEINTILDKIKRSFQLKKLTLRQVMQSADPQNTGFVSFYSFQKGMEFNGIVFSPSEFEAIKANFGSNSMINIQLLQSRLNLDCTDALIEINRLLNLQNTTIADALFPYDRHRTGKILASDFIRAIGQPRLTQVIANSFVDQNGYVNYRSIQSYLEKILTQRQINSSLLPDAVQKVLRQIISRRIDFDRSFAEADVLHVGALADSRFLTILGTYGIQFSPSEGAQIASHYAQNSRVNYIAFLQDVEAARAKVNHEENPATPPPQLPNPNEVLALLREEIIARHVSPSAVIKVPGEGDQIPLPQFSRNLAHSSRNLTLQQCEALGNNFLVPNSMGPTVDCSLVLKALNIPEQDFYKNTVFGNPAFGDSGQMETHIQGEESSLAETGISLLKDHILKRHIDISSLLPSGQYGIKQMAKALLSIQTVVDGNTCLAIAEYFNGDFDKLIQALRIQSNAEKVMIEDNQQMIAHTIEIAAQKHDLDTIFLKVDRYRSYEIPSDIFFQILGIPIAQGLTEAIQAVFPGSMSGLINYHSFLLAVENYKNSQMNVNEDSNNNNGTPIVIKKVLEYINKCANGVYVDLDQSFQEMDRFGHGTIHLNQFYQIMANCRCNITSQAFFDYYTEPNNRSLFNYRKFLNDKNSIQNIQITNKNISLQTLRTIKISLLSKRTNLMQLCEPYDRYHSGLIANNNFVAILQENRIPLTQQEISDIVSILSQRGTIPYKKLAQQIEREVILTQEEINSTMDDDVKTKLTDKAVAAALEIKTKLSVRRKTIGMVFRNTQGMISKAQFKEQLEDHNILLLPFQIDAISQIYGNGNLIDLNAFINVIQKSSIV